MRNGYVRKEKYSALPFLAIVAKNRILHSDQLTKYAMFYLWVYVL